MRWTGTRPFLGDCKLDQVFASSVVAHPGSCLCIYREAVSQHSPGQGNASFASDSAALGKRITDPIGRANRAAYRRTTTEAETIRPQYRCVPAVTRFVRPKVDVDQVPRAATMLVKLAGLALGFVVKRLRRRGSAKCHSE